MGSRMFWKGQYGKETVRGTAVAATKRWWGSISVPKDRTIQHPEYELGIRAASGNTDIRQILVDGLKLEATDGYYQALPAIFGILLKGGVTATEQTTGKADYLWDFTPSLTALAAPDTLTVQYGDNDQAYAVEYVMGKTFTIESNAGEDAAAKISLDCFGKQISKTTFTSSITAPATVEPIVANTMQMWMDGTWANLGTTAQTSTLRKAKIEIGTGNHPKFFAEGAKTLSSYGEGDIYGAVQMTLEGGANAVAILDAYQAGTPKALRFKWTGGLIASGSLPYSLIVELYGTFDEVIPLSGDQDGNTLYGAVFSTLSDQQATPHNVGVKVSVNQNAY